MTNQTTTNGTQRRVDEALRKSLGQTPKTPVALHEALERVYGETTAAAAPGEALFADFIGGLSISHANLVAFAKLVYDNVVYRLRRLQPIKPESDSQAAEALIQLVHSQLDELIEAINAEGGPVTERVELILNTLLGDKQVAEIGGDKELFKTLPILQSQPRSILRRTPKKETIEDLLNDQPTLLKDVKTWIRRVPSLQELDWANKYLAIKTSAIASPNGQNLLDKLAEAIIAFDKKHAPLFNTREDQQVIADYQYIVDLLIMLSTWWKLYTLREDTDLSLAIFKLKQWFAAISDAVNDFREVLETLGCGPADQELWIVGGAPTLVQKTSVAAGLDWMQDFAVEEGLILLEHGRTGFYTVSETLKRIQALWSLIEAWAKDHFKSANKHQQRLSQSLAELTTYITAATQESAKFSSADP